MELVATVPQLINLVDEFDQDKCSTLLTRGRWLDNNHQHWQPLGCMMHKYEEEDVVTCLRDRRVTFIGDSTTRNLFWALARKLGFAEQGEEDRHADHSLHLRGVSIEFIWDPYLNSSSLYREVTVASLLTEGIGVADTTSILLIGGGLWHARYLEEEYLPQYMASLRQISNMATSEVEVLLDKRDPARSVDVVRADSLILLAPVPVLAYKSLSQARAETITPNKVETMNRHLQQVSAEMQMPVVWSFTSMTASEEKAYQSDGLHATEVVTSSMVDVLLNAGCNAVLRQFRTARYPMDKTCCNSYEDPNWTQTLILNVSMWLIPLSVLVTRKDSKRFSYSPSNKILRAIMVLALAICYCYYADRTQLFNKVQKHYNRGDFLRLCVIVLLLGVLSVRRSTCSSQKRTEGQILQVRDQSFLSRDQTDEWKGWMQLVILIYHYTGASKVLWIYRTIRLLVASYLFLSGYGHTMFFYKKADYSLRRCAAVLIRVNMLSCILPYVMRTDYLFYYFAPLISFWYIVTYCTMAVGHQRNHSPVFLIAKVLISAILVSMLVRFPALFETLFYVLEKTCNISWDVTEWRFRLNLDSYIVYAGMLCAVAYIRLTVVLRSDGPTKTGFDGLVQRYFNQMRFTLGIYAILILPIFFVSAHMVSSKQEYNSWVPYVSTIPILSFVILRNFSRQARNYHSLIFAWVGRHSLETFTLQFHIWLAADTKGLLALGVLERASGDALDGRKFDMALLTIIFIWVCWHVAAATQTLTSWLVDPQEGSGCVEAEEGIRDEENGFLRTKSKLNVVFSTSLGGLLEEVVARAFRSASRLRRIVAGHLEARLLIIFGVMWLLNIMDL